MGKKIVVITGSPRRNGNSSAMAEAFIREAEKNGHTVTRFDAALRKLDGCHACLTCFKTGKACSFDDDFNLVAPAILDADAVIFATPVYWYSIPSQIKAVIDRLYSFFVAKKSIGGKQWGLICCCADDDMSVFDGVRIPLERSAGLLGWTEIGEVLVPALRNPGDVEKTDGIVRAAELADSLGD
jgi:putative NADPH-quinone reductase